MTSKTEKFSDFSVTIILFWPGHLAQDTCVLAQDTCVLAQDTCVSGQDACVLAHDTCVSGQDTCALRHNTCVLGQDMMMICRILVFWGGLGYGSGGLGYVSYLKSRPVNCVKDALLCLLCLIACKGLLDGPETRQSICLIVRPIKLTLSLTTSTQAVLCILSYISTGVRSAPL